MSGVATKSESPHEIIRDNDGLMLPEERASNNKFDIHSARDFYKIVQQMRIPMIVVSRHAINAAKIPKSVYDDLAATGHPVAIRLMEMQKAAIDDIWQQMHIPPNDPRRTYNPTLDKKWFCDFFLGGRGVDLKSKDEVWDLVTDLSVYDPITAIAACPELRERFFSPVEVVTNRQKHLVIGVSAENHGVRDPDDLRQFLISGIYEAVRNDSR